MPWLCHSAQRAVRGVGRHGAAQKAARKGTGFSGDQGRDVPLMPVGVPVTPADAVARIRQNNHEPVEPYPGRVNDPWMMRCMICGHESLKRLSRTSAIGGKNYSAFGCRPCSRLESRMACSVIFPSGNRCLEPIARHRGGKCNLCGLSPVKLSSRLCELTDPRTGERCVAKHRQNGMCAPHNDRARRNGDPFYERKSPYIISGDEATAVMKARGLTPLEPYHGATDPWLCRCDTCGKESTPRFSSRNSTFGCRYCGNKRGGVALRTPAAEAVAVMEGRSLWNRSLTCIVPGSASATPVGEHSP